jgi:hypothetical protein
MQNNVIVITKTVSQCDFQNEIWMTFSSVYAINIYYRVLMIIRWAVFEQIAYLDINPKQRMFVMILDI